MPPPSTTQAPAPTTQGLDPDAVNLAKAIRQVETGGDPTAHGKSGEYGAYQFTPNTWSKMSSAAGVNVPLEQASLEQQNQVAYHQIKSWKDTGYNPGQIASLWNSGKPDAYLDPTYKGTNSSGAKYDVPAYATSVANAYHKIKGGSQVNPDPGNPSSVNSTQNASTGENPLVSGAKAVANFAFPIVGDLMHDAQGNNTKTGLQQLGDLGLSAMWFAPGLGEVGEGARVALTGAKLAEGVGGALTKGALTGYGVDVASNLSQGKTGGGAFTPGLGTVTGGVLGGIGGKIASRAAETPTSRLAAQTNRLKTLQKAFTDNSSAETNPIRTLEDNGLIKHLTVTGNKVNAEGLTNINGTGALDNMIEQQSGDASNLVKSLEGGTPLKAFQKTVIDAVKSNPVIRDAGKIPTAIAEVNRRFGSFEQSFGKTLPWEVVDNIRTAMNREYDPEVRDVARTIGDAARKLLYNGSGTNTALKSAMQNEGELIKARNFVERLHGTTVPGGQLGKYVAEGIGSAVGGTVGSVGGPVGGALGIPAGAYTAGKLTDLLHGRYFKPVGAGVSGLVNRAAKSGIGQIAKKALLRGAASNNP